MRLDSTFARYAALGLPALSLMTLYLITRANYPLSQGLVAGTTVAVAAFMVAWCARAMRDAPAVACMAKAGPPGRLIAPAVRRPDAPGAGAHPQEPPRRLRVLVADDHGHFRHLVVESLRLDPAIDVVGEARDGEDTLRQAHALRPDAVLLDVSMPRMNGVEAARRLRAELPQTVVIALSAYDDSDPLTATMLQAGASRCVLKGASGEDIAAAIRAACRR